MKYYGVKNIEFYLEFQKKNHDFKCKYIKLNSNFVFLDKVLYKECYENLSDPITYAWSIIVERSETSLSTQSALCLCVCVFVCLFHATGPNFEPTDLKF